VLARVTLSSRSAQERKAKAVSVRALQRKDVIVDGYNVLITVESLLAGCSVYLCDDGFLRDVRGIFKRYRPSGLTDSALSIILDLLAFAAPSKIEILLDQQMSCSGKLAARIREQMACRRLPGTACTAKDTDHLLKTSLGVVASADGYVIDGASNVVDLPAEIARMRGINLLRI